MSNDDIVNAGGPGSSSGEPSMEEILASIRRILSQTEGEPAPVELDEEVLVLESGMIAKPADLATGTAPPEAAPAAAAYAAGGHIASEPRLSTGPDPVPGLAPDPAAGAAAAPPPAPKLASDPQLAYIPPDATEAAMSDHIEPPESLISDQARESAKNSVGALVRSLGAERAVAVSRAGVTIEDIVREEIRPMLKSWLDTHLPTLVERIVRSEIERVIDRTQA